MGFGKGKGFGVVVPVVTEIGVTKPTTPNLDTAVITLPVTAAQTPSLDVPQVTLTVS